MNLRFYGKRKEKGAAFIGSFALQPHPSSMQRDQPAYQGQPEARSLLLARIRRVRLFELTKDTLLIFRFDADSRIADGDAEAVLVALSALRVSVWLCLQACSKLNASALRSKLNGIAEQIVDDLLEFRLIRSDEERSFYRFHRECNMLFYCLRPGDLLNAVQRGSDVEQGIFQSGLSGFDF